ncbi:MAG: DNA repair protein RadC [Pseudomonadota bacterium]
MTTSDGPNAPQPTRKKQPADGPEGHRKRLRARVVEHGAEGLADYELLELLLFGAQPRGDTKPLAKRLLARFGSLSAVLTASPEDLHEEQGMGPVSSSLLKAVQEAGRRLAREVLLERPLLTSWTSVVDYCRTQIGHEPVEHFYLLFLDSRNQLITDERHQRGTVNHTPVYVREVIKRALDHGASGLILVHNHPSGDASPSAGDIAMTDQIVEAAQKLGIRVHDHIIITKKDEFSFRSNGLFPSPPAAKPPRQAKRR